MNLTINTVTKYVYSLCTDTSSICSAQKLCTYTIPWKPNICTTDQVRDKTAKEYLDMKINTLENILTVYIPVYLDVEQFLVLNNGKHHVTNKFSSNKYWIYNAKTQKKQTIKSLRFKILKTFDEIQNSYGPYSNRSDYNKGCWD